MGWTRSAAAAAALLVSVSPLAAATPAAEQAFLAAYRTAFLAKDGKAIAALVHTEGANPTVLDFYLSLLTADLGKGELTLELQNLVPGELESATRAMPGPGGGLVRLSPQPYKKLSISVAIRNANSTTTNTSSIYLVDEGDKVRIAVPVDVK